MWVSEAINHHIWQSAARYGSMLAVAFTRTTLYSRQLAVRTAAVASGLAAVLAFSAPVQAAPLWPGGPDLGLPGPAAAPVISPGEGSVVGGKRAIEVQLPAPAADRAAAEAGIQISANGVPGEFTWTSDRNVRWAPRDHWPRGASVSVTVGRVKSQFRVAEELTAVADAGAHTFTVKIGEDVVRTMPASMGKPTHKTPNGSFGVLEKFPHMVMDSSTYGVRVDSKEGYRLPVEYATRLTWSGIFVHAAPWSAKQQGKDNVSHGCINVSTENAKWYFENVRKGDNVVIQNA